MQSPAQKPDLTQLVKHSTSWYTVHVHPLSMLSRLGNPRKFSKFVFLDIISKQGVVILDLHVHVTPSVLWQHLLILLLAYLGWGAMVPCPLLHVVSCIRNLLICYIHLKRSSLLN